MLFTFQFVEKCEVFEHLKSSNFLSFDMQNVRLYENSYRQCIDFLDPFLLFMRVEKRKVIRS